MEEVLTFPRYLPLVLDRLPSLWRLIGGPIALGQVWLAMVSATLIPFVLVDWATLRPEQALPVWPLLAIQTTLLLNVLWHVGAAVVLLEGYTPAAARGEGRLDQCTGALGAPAEPS